MSEKEPSRAIPVNASHVEPLRRIRATLSHDTDGNLVVSNTSCEVVDPRTPEEIDKLNRVRGKLREFVAGNRTAWDEEVQAYYEANRDANLDSSSDEE
jgi:hypothetical protein